MSYDNVGWAEQVGLFLEILRRMEDHGIHVKKSEPVRMAGKLHIRAVVLDDMSPSWYYVYTSGGDMVNVEYWEKGRPRAINIFLVACGPDKAAYEFVRKEGGADA